MTARLSDDGTNILVDGVYYGEALKRAHEALRPKRYFEIGCLHGDTLRLASCSAIAVDPVRRLKADVALLNPRMRFYEQTSDDFFATHQPKVLLGGTIDLAFLDGMHEFPFLLRDFINTELNCDRESWILLHDCLPGDAHMTRLLSDLGKTAATNFPGWWTGDVWKMVPVLRELRPDLKIVCLDAPPTGLVAITNLNPQSRVLEQHYPALIEAWAAVNLNDWGIARLFETAAPVSTEKWLSTLKRFDLWKRSKLAVTGLFRNQN